MHLSPDSCCNELRLFVDSSQTLWTHDPAKPGVDSAGSVAGALDSEMLEWLSESKTCVRVLASVEHARLLVWLLSRVPWERVWLGPLRCKDPDPSLLLSFDELAPRGLKPSCGGWRISGEADLVTYMMAMNDGPVSSLHPAFQAVTFPFAANLRAAADVIVEMVDPRWFVNPADPDSYSWLYEHFGWGRNAAKNAKRLLGGPPGSGEQLGRAYKVYQACGGETPAPVAPEVNLRSWNGIFGFRSTSDVQTMVRACRGYLRFIAAAWLDALTPSRSYYFVRDRVTLSPQSTYAPQLFVPRLFFPTQNVVAAWTQHCNDRQADEIAG